MIYTTFKQMAHQTSKEWAKEYPTPEETAHPVPKRFLEIFAKLVAEKEREWCASFIEELDERGFKELAGLIRSRGQE